ncbi:hypothetical protein FHS39_001772 [Streptomyces olivoverticillatus]|uniref:Lipoprotein n=1 Tax=Streptomyces olivoverticillatus TaxID=66427 RepID=A0A7W7PJ42_9ACTN|nr:GerMN domain-containing protein [Streptomyces olivoverticillatus]MBB4892761.1 hypothetical protein [Streptomyces olivoverticillatus]
MRRAVWLLPTALVLAACGVTPTAPVRVGEPATGIQEPGTSRHTVRLYFLSPFGIYPVARAEPSDATPQRAVDLLLAGPTPAERARGLITEVPWNLGRVTATAAPGAVDLVLPVPVSTLQPAAVSQLACTAAAAGAPGGSPVTGTGIRIHEPGAAAPWTLRCSSTGYAFPVPEATPS